MGAKSARFGDSMFTLANGENKPYYTVPAEI
jgi:hypothetical protein